MLHIVTNGSSCCKMVENFDIVLYIEFSCFIQQQQVNFYQLVESLYSVTVTYNNDGKKL
jgi:hypothetical protein